VLLALSHLGGRAQRVPVDAWQKGSLLRHPEALSGLWQAEIDHRIFGFQIELTATARRIGNNPEAIAQRLDQASVEVFEQRGAARTVGEGNWFQSGIPGVRWDGNHLKIDTQTSTNASMPSINIDMQFDPQADSWTGRFHRGSLDLQATLRRPRPVAAAKSPFAGTWKRAAAGNNCLHIAEGAGGDLFAWTDDLAVPPAPRNSRKARAPADTLENYGTAAQVQLHSAHHILIQMRALSSGCCTIDTGGTLVQDGARIRSNSKSEGNRNPGAEDWFRVHGNSCLAGAPD
jgi:hypothetical protein